MLKYFADTLVYQVMNIQAGTMLGEALDFFFYDTMKVFLLLGVIRTGRHHGDGHGNEFLNITGCKR